MRRARQLLAAGAAALLADGAEAQHMNRAVWLGFEEEGVRRDFRQGTEYFLDRMSYVVAPPWHDPDLSIWGNQVRYAFGSVTSSEFTFEGRVDHEFELGDGVGFHYHVLQSEHRDTRFLRNAIGLSYQLDETSALFAQGTPFGDKSLIDVSVGGWLWRRDDDGLRAMVTLVDAPSDKSEVTEFESAPYGLHVAGAFGERDDLRVSFDVGAQLPFRARRLEDDAVLDFERYLAAGEARLRLARRDWLVCAVDAEYTDKRLAPAMADDPLREHFHRTFAQLRAEWYRDDGRNPWSIGVVHTMHDESGLRPNDASADLRTRRREWFGVARVQLPIDGRLSLEPQLFAGHVQDRYRDGLDDRDRSRFEGKIAWNARWDFSERAHLVLIVSTQLDELAFGGGGAQFVARF